MYRLYRYRFCLHSHWWTELIWTWYCSTGASYRRGWSPELSTWLETDGFSLKGRPIHTNPGQRIDHYLSVGEANQHRADSIKSGAINCAHVEPVYEPRSVNWKVYTLRGCHQPRQVDNDDCEDGDDDRHCLNNHRVCRVRPHCHSSGSGPSSIMLSLSLSLSFFPSVFLWDSEKPTQEERNTDKNPESE